MASFHKSVTNYISQTYQRTAMNKLAEKELIVYCLSDPRRGRAHLLPEEDATQRSGLCRAGEEEEDVCLLHDGRMRHLQRGGAGIGRKLGAIECVLINKYQIPY